MNHLHAAIVELEVCETMQGEEVVIGLDDMTMERYKGVNVVFDYTKVVGIPVTLCWVDGGVMVGTEEGTIAYY